MSKPNKQGQEGHNVKPISLYPLTTDQALRRALNAKKEDVERSERAEKAERAKKRKGKDQKK